MGKLKSWAERLAKGGSQTQIKAIPERLAKRSGTGSMVIPAPVDVDAAIRQVRRRRLATAREIAAGIARKHGTTLCCTVTTGILAWIAAHAAHEAELKGRKRITPYWRVLKANGEINGKYPGGPLDVKRRLEAEGHVVIRSGRHYFVKDFEKKLTAM